jgi:PAS domain-containing protein
MPRTVPSAAVSRRAREVSKKMDEETYFAPARRAGEAELRREIDFVAGSPVMTVLLRTANGLLAVLNVDRQVIAVNDAFLKELGIGDPRAVFGLRPGEVIQCFHADDMPGGVRLHLHLEINEGDPMCSRG